jgi:hypothetical protein
MERKGVIFMEDDCMKNEPTFYILISLNFIILGEEIIAEFHHHRFCTVNEGIKTAGLSMPALLTRDLSRPYPTGERLE